MIKVYWLTDNDKMIMTFIEMEWWYIDWLLALQGPLAFRDVRNI